ncbi:hypothetical protein MIMGU_mgv1a022257mg, partial [Erythranthe guttata]
MVVLAFNTPFNFPIGVALTLNFPTTTKGELRPERKTKRSGLPNTCHGPTVQNYMHKSFNYWEIQHRQKGLRHSIQKKWRYLCSYVPNLFFNYENSDTITRVLLLRKLQNINTFSLFDDTKRNYHQIETWITFAVERSVQNIDIYLTVHLDSPRCLFTCKTLIDLRLDHCGLIPDRGSIVFLPHLKRLHLIHVKYEGDDSLSHLISGCPVLEELLLQLCIDYCSCKISSPTIKMLDVSYHFDKESENQDYNKVEINTPALVYLELLDYANQHIKCRALTSLIEADIEID